MNETLQKESKNYIIGHHDGTECFVRLASAFHSAALFFSSLCDFYSIYPYCSQYYYFILLFISLKIHIMYLPSSKSEANYEADIMRRLLSSPIQPDEQELMHLHCCSSSIRNNNNSDNDETDSDDDKTYFWNDIATLQSKMLEYLPMNHEKRLAFQDAENAKADVSYMEFLQPDTRWCRAYRVTQEYLQKQQWSTSTVHTNFFHGLLDCPPMQLGFHTLAIPEWCYCPLSLPAWCHKNKIDPLFGGASKPYCSCKERSPNAFMAHVEAMKRRPIPGVDPDRPVLIEELHAILYVYLMAYYDHYLIPRLCHHGMYPLQSDKYNQGVSAKYARLSRWMELGLQKRERLQREMLEQQKKLQEMQKIKEILHKVLHKKEMEVRERRNSLFQKAHEVLGITDVDKAKERQPYSRIEYKACRQAYLTGTIELLFDHHIKYSSSSSSGGTKLKKVTFEDSSSEYMKRLWNDRDHPYLFEDSICEMEESFFMGMDASPNSGKSCLFCFNRVGVYRYVYENSHRTFNPNQTTRSMIKPKMKEDRRDSFFRYCGVTWLALLSKRQIGTERHRILNCLQSPTTICNPERTTT